ncbi:helix-turn-helix domain-containing protein [Bradyrhizobium daqingense]|uniref:helix-turn-helix domain-containing protein n=1 Tax=Bradyrhizobium daqingense TaxID=993502 RepID=UPI003850A324
MSRVIPLKSEARPTSAARLLVSRDQAREMLGGISVSHLRRLMEAGELQPVFLNASPKRQRSGKLYFRYADLEALVEKYAARTAP